MKSARSQGDDVPFWLAIAPCVGLLIVAVTDVSLWTDEGFIAWAIDHRTPIQMLHALVPPMIVSEADRQYPLYDLYMWAWAHLFGSGELVLRSSNVPFAAFYVVALAFGSRYGLGNRFTWVPFALSPFVWYYMNEVRPYLMLAALSAGVVSATVVYAFGSADASRRARAWILPLFLVAWATHILAVLVVPGLLVVLYLSRRERTRDLTAWRGTVALWSLPLLALAFYYGSTILGGRGSAEIANNAERGGTPAAFAVEALYEQAGFAGLGPSRSDLRAGGLRGPGAVLPVAGALALVVALLLSIRSGDRRKATILAAAWIVSFGCAFVISEVLHARFLGRHFAAVFPLFGMAVIASSRTRLTTAIVFAVFAVSDFRLAALPYYGKDDYRAAVATAIEQGQRYHATIDWSADDYTANYYGLALFDGRLNADRTHEPWPVRASGDYVVGAPPAAVLMLVKEQLSGGAPVVLAISRPDIFDARRGWQDTIRRLHPTLVATYREFFIFRFDPAR